MTIQEILASLPDHWTVQDVLAKWLGTDLGQCHYGPHTIWIKRTLKGEQRRETLAHEIAHARTPGAGHGKVWQTEYLRLIS